MYLIKYNNCLIVGLRTTHIRLKIRSSNYLSLLLIQAVILYLELNKMCVILNLITSDNYFEESIKVYNKFQRFQGYRAYVDIPIKKISLSPTYLLHCMLVLTKQSN